jgi:hypothetical protein
MRYTSPPFVASRHLIALAGATVIAIILALLIFSLSASGQQGTKQGNAAHGVYKVTVTKDGKVITPGSGGKGPINKPIQVNMPTGPDFRYSPTADQSGSLVPGQPPPVIRGIAEDTMRYAAALKCVEALAKYGAMAAYWYPSCGLLYGQGAYQAYQLALCYEKYTAKECLGLVEPTGKQKGGGGSKNKGDKANAGGGSGKNQGGANKGGNKGGGGNKDKGGGNTTGSGSSTGTDTTGGSGSTTGTDTTGTDTTGTDTTGTDTTGTDTTGGSGSSTGADTTGGDTTGGSGSSTGADTTGSGTTGAGTTGGDTTSGGTTDSGSTTGGTPQ